MMRPWAAVALAGGVSALLFGVTAGFLPRWSAEDEPPRYEADGGLKPALRTAVEPDPERGLGRQVGAGCLAEHAEGEQWPDRLGGMEGIVTCTEDRFHFWPVRHVQPRKHPLLQQNTVLCYYGNRVAGSMGILGQHSLQELERRMQRLAGEYDKVNGDLGVTLCLDYIYLVANASGHPYSHQTPYPELFEEAMQFASDRGWAFFVDLQLGYRDLETEVRAVLPALKNPNVHLSLDTEFYMQRRGGIPGDTLGAMDAEDVNKAVRILQDFVEREHLPGKILMVWQFDPVMLTNKDRLDLRAPGVTVLINADGVGFGGVEGKLNDYREYAQEPRDALGIKLFYRQDVRVLRPEEVMEQEPPPDVVVYQ